MKISCVRIARQHSRVRFLEEGDANTRYFHLQACHRNRKNQIPTLQQDGLSFSADEAKANLFFNYYNGILGVPFQRQHLIVLDGLLPQLDLTDIDACFTEAEIWVAIKDMPPDRAPRPDGFCSRFYRVVWEVIKHDIVCAFNALWSLDARSFHLLNDALMILLRKNAAPSCPKDFRPISLMHSFSKLFVKCLARRLAPWLHDIVAQKPERVHQGSRRPRQLSLSAIGMSLVTVQATPVGAREDRHRQSLDSVAWPFLLDVLRHIGFPRRWTNWISILLSTASTKVLLNGRPGRRIAHARGLRQGDPLSPMLFVIVMEVLNSLIRDADRSDALTPLRGRCSRIGHRSTLTTWSSWSHPSPMASTA